MTFKVPSKPEIPTSLAGLGLQAKLGILPSEPWESLNFRHCLVAFFFPFSFLNSDFLVSIADA